MAKQQLQIVWTDYRNLALLIAAPPESQKQSASTIRGFDTCKISHALRMNPVIHENLIQESVQPPEYEDVVAGYEPDMDFKFETETMPVKSDSLEQVNLLTTENLEALLEHVMRSVGNPPSVLSFADQEPPPDDATDLVPRKIRRRDPRPGVVVAEPKTELITETQIHTTIVEPTETTSPNIREDGARSSSHTEDIDYDSFLAGEIGIRVMKERMFCLMINPLT
ncbi:hypothetical protein R6Q57_009103 [Mikania cordata]